MKFLFLFSTFVLVASSQELMGEDCQYVDFGSVANVAANCPNGTEMVLSTNPGFKKQFLLVDGKALRIQENWRKFLSML